MKETTINVDASVDRKPTVALANVDRYTMAVSIPLYCKENPMNTRTETIRWTNRDSYDRCRELEARLTDDTPVTITACGETHVMTTSSEGTWRYARLPFGRWLWLNRAVEWTAEVPVENQAPAWLDLAKYGDMVRDRHGDAWVLRGNKWYCVGGKVKCNSDGLLNCYSPITPIILEGKPAIAWSEVDAAALKTAREIGWWSPSDADAVVRGGSRVYDSGIATVRALCTVYDEPA